MMDLVQAIGNGLLLGAVYALLGLCIVLIYKASGVFNFAIGQFLIIGAYLFYFFYSGLSLPVYVSLPLGILAAAAMGSLIERLTINPLLGRDPIFMTKATLGLYFFLGALLQIGLVYLGSPGWAPLNLPDISLQSDDLVFLSENIWAAVFAGLTFLAVALFFFFSHWGLAIRAVSEDQAKALAYGIDSRFILMLAWALSAVSVAICGILISNAGILSASIASVGFRAIPVALIGGFDSVLGALIAGCLIGVFETIIAMYVEPLGLIGFKDVAVYILMLIVLFIRPSGLFGTVPIERV
jgi:branched-chain amino acid transport system permease protein